MATLASIALMVVDHRYQHLGQVRTTLAFIVYPLHYLADLPVTASLQIQQWSTSRETLVQDNKKLHRENLKLRAELQKHKALQAENLRLRNLLDSSLKIGDRVLIAELSTVDLDPYRQQVVVNKGSASGVFNGQPVLDADAVMGQIIETRPFSSTVLLITDASHSTPVQVLRNGLRTLAVGSGHINKLDLPYLPINSDIEVGDLLVTSGLGGKFPPGYPVATVTHIDRSPKGSFAEITAQPAAHLDRSREVLLIWRINAESTPNAETEKDGA